MNRIEATQPVDRELTDLELNTIQAGSDGGVGVSGTIRDPVTGSVSTGRVDGVFAK